MKNGVFGQIDAALERVADELLGIKPCPHDTDGDGDCPACAPGGSPLARQIHRNWYFDDEERP